MQIGYNEATAKNCSTLEEDLRLCEQYGFDFIEIRLEMLRAYLKHHPITDLCDFFAQSHLKPHALNAIYLYPSLFGPDDREEECRQFLDTFRFALEAGKTIGSNAIVVVAPMHQGPYHRPFSSNWQQCQEDCVRILSKLAAIAGDFGTKLCFEPVGAPCCSVRTVGQARKVVEAVGHPLVGYLLDACNLYMAQEENPFQEIGEISFEKIFGVHINDFKAMPQQELHPEKRCFCGAGVIDLEAFLCMLQKTGYQGMVSIETFQAKHLFPLPKQVIEEAYQTTYALLRANRCIA